MPNKFAYFQGGGGVNEPEPKKKKYPVDKAIVVQPRFKEPFYYNYDLYDAEGVSGPAQHGPGSGWNHMDEHKSIKEFLDFRRKRLEGKYVADDSYIEDTPANYKERVNKMKIRASLFDKIVKQAADENDGPNFDYGKGLYSNMDKYKSVEDFEEHADKGPGAFFADDNANFYHGGYTDLAKAIKENPRRDYDIVYDDDNDLGTGFYENLEHYKSVRDFIEHTPLGYEHGAKIKPEWERAKDVNHIDFPVDDDINHDQRIYPEEAEYQIRREMGTDYEIPSEGSPLGLENLNISLTSPQISGEHTYLPNEDFDGRSDDALNFGRDYDDESAPVGRTWDEAFVDDLNAEMQEKEWDLDRLAAKYDSNDDFDMLTPAETEIYGLPDGVEPEAKDADKTIQNQNPWDTKSDISREMYEDKWNI